jgi:hypothetical protein
MQQKIIYKFVIGSSLYAFLLQLLIPYIAVLIINRAKSTNYAIFTKMNFLLERNLFFLEKFKPHETLSE